MSGNSAAKNPQTPKSGSAASGAEPDFLVIGQIVKPHGVRGEVSVKVLTDFPERFDGMEAVFLGDEHSAEMVVVASTRWHRERVLMTFEGYSDRTTADTLRGKYLKIPREDAVELEPGTYYHYQLEGLTVITDEGETLGTLAYVLETGANDVYVVQTPDGELLLPATAEVVQAVDIAAGKITVHLIPGLR